MACNQSGAPRYEGATRWATCTLRDPEDRAQEGRDRMTTEEVTFFSAGSRIAGTLKLPETGSAPYPAVVQGPGWLGLRDGKNYVPCHDGLLEHRLLCRKLNQRFVKAAKVADKSIQDPNLNGSVSGQAKQHEQATEHQRGEEAQ